MAIIDYPVEIDPSVDQFATKHHFGTASCTTVGNTRLSSGRSLVYLLHSYEGNKLVETPIGWERCFKRRITVLGYEKKVRQMLLGFIPLPYYFDLKKVETIDMTEQEAVRHELCSKLNKRITILFQNL